MIKIVLFILSIIFSSFSAHEKPSSGAGCLQLDIIVVGDASSSMGENIFIVQDAIKAFIERFDLSEEGIRMGLIRFSDDARLLSPLTTDKGILRMGCERINNANGMTAMEDAFMVANNEFMEHGRPNVAKIIVFITDGDPNSKDRTREALALLKMTTNPTICGVFVHGMQNDDETFLEEISSDYCYVKSDFDNLINEIKKLDICL